MSDPRMLIPELEHEMATTRRVIERIPEDRLDFTPHERSWTVGELAAHTARLPGWAAGIFTTDGFDMAEVPPEEAPGSVESILGAFDERCDTAKSALASATHEDMAEEWTLRNAEHVYFTMPRAAVYRSMVMSHMIHHRGQLTVYLRLMGVPVPSVYGPSADES